MRVELIYAPGCNTFRKAKNILEMVIAEERLPIPVELVEDASHGSPSVRINGKIAQTAHHFEQLKDLLSGHWKEHSQASPSVI